MKTYLSSIPMRIYRLAHFSPDRTAVIDSDLETYSYRTLYAMADAIQDSFPQKAPQRIGLLTKAGINQIAAILAILKSGATYYPLDTALSGASLRKYAADARLDFTITDSENAPRLGNLEALTLPQKIQPTKHTDSIPLDLGDKTIACAMLSDNGQTTELSRIALRRHARSLSNQFDIKKDDVVLQSAPASSPIFLAQAFATMMKGAAMAILPEQNRAYAKAIADFSERAGVTLILGARPMVDELGLLKRLPSHLRLIAALAADRLSAMLAEFNKKYSWKDIFTIRQLATANA